MQYLTSVLLAAFVAYAGAFYLGAIEGNFPLLLFVAVVVTGLYWFAERFYFLPNRKAAAQALADDAKKRQADLEKQGIIKLDLDVTEAQKNTLAQPWWLDWTAGLFPVILVVFILRSFAFEPFKIPTGSMIPTLLIDDLILVNKFHYGVRLPILHTKIIDGASPQAGDVMVFRYPPDPSKDYIKRVVGVPGDEVSYLNKVLKINGKEVSKVAQEQFLDISESTYTPQFEEKLGAKTHRILNKQDVPSGVSPIADFAYKENCQYSIEGIVCKVPEGHYFMMGDNRDNSLDSRYWGFVPEDNIVGKASFIWMHFSDFSRIGSFN